MGIIAKQASKNLVFIVLGFFAGAVNTLIVLPAAFENDPENWGLLRSITSWFMILSQVFNFGSSGILIRYFPRFRENPHALYKFSLSVAAIGIAAMGLLLFFFGRDLLELSHAEGIDALAERLDLVFLLATTYILFITMQGFVNALLKSTFHQFLNETFLKTYYLAIVLTYLFGFINFTQLLVVFCLGYLLALLALAIYSFRHGFRIKLKTPKLEGRGEMMVYGFLSILDRGAQTIVNNLDIIMIGLIIGMDDVGFFTLAAYIGTVTQMPQRAIQVIANPLVSKALEENDTPGLRDIYLKSSLNQLILGGALFLAIWAGIDELMGLMPGDYGQGKWVVLFIAISKLIYMASGVSGPIIVYSKYYPVNLVFNIFLIALTITTNYFLISPNWFNLGIEGAALATATSFLLYNLAKIIFVQKKFKINPITARLLGVMVLIGIIAAPLHAWTVFPDYLIAAIAVKSGLGLLVFGCVVYALRISPDINQMVGKMLRRLK